MEAVRTEGLSSSAWGAGRGVTGVVYLGLGPARGVLPSPRPSSARPACL